MLRSPIIVSEIERSIMLQMILSVLVGIAGLAKLLGAKPISAQFAEFGLPKAAMYVVGLLEVAAAIGLWIGPLALWAACGVVFLMFGAIFNHVKAKHGPGQTAPSIVVMLLAMYVVYNSLASVA